MKKTTTLLVVITCSLLLLSACDDGASSNSTSDPNTDDSPGEVSSEEMIEQSAPAARDAQRSSDLAQVGSAINDYFSSVYDSRDLDTELYPPVDTYAELESYLVPEFMIALPQDPSLPGNYYYVVSDDSFGFILAAWSESDDGLVFKRSVDSTEEMDAALEEQMGEYPF